MKLINIIKAKLIILTLLVSGLVQAQERTISGKVTDVDSGLGLPGVNVVQKGTATGTVTDIDGNYKISVGSNATLVFSFVGYTTEEVNIGSRSVIDVQLTTDITQLSEVVVVGYGEQEQEDVTGVVAQVESENFNQGAIVSPDDLIAGKIAGVLVAPGSGEPGAKPTIRIRGTSSITASNEPLYIIDGVPVDNVGFGGGRNPLNFLNTSDIESFTVLKDASAAAIYGSRGTNGVILITTKKGSFNSKPQVTYNGFVSVANAIDKVDMLNGNEYRELTAAVAPNRSELLYNANTDWQAQLYREAIGQKHELGISGGTESIGYRLSLGYQQQEGIIRKSETEKATLGLNLNAKAIDDHLKFNLSFKGSKTNDVFQDGGALGNAIGFAPTQPIYDANNTRFGGYWEWPVSFGTAVGLNPVSLVDQSVNQGEAWRALTNLKIDYDVHGVDGLRATVVAGYDLLQADNASFQPSTLRNQLTTEGNIFLENTTRTNELFDFYLSYERELDAINSTFDVMFGYEYQFRLSEFPSVTGQMLDTDAFGLQSMFVASEITYRPGVVPQRIRSYFGRANYSYDNKYLLTLTLRRDASSQFGPENQAGWFPSVGLGWRIKDEAFMQDIDVVTDLKLRASYGVLGNQDFSPFAYVTTYTPGDQFSRYVIGGVPIITQRPSARNEEIKWEETRQLNFGLDFSVLDGKINGSLDYYKKTTEDLILNVPVPAGTNLSNFVTTNIGELENEGFELAINAVAIDKGDFRWDLSYNFATNRNEITSLEGTEGDIPVLGVSGGVGTNVGLITEGEAINSFYLYRHKMGENGRPLVDGVDHNEDGSINLADMYEDTDGDGDVDLDDRVIAGNPFPEIQMGLSSYLRYKNFDLNFTLRGSFGMEIYNNNASFSGNYSRVQTDIVPGNMHRSVLTNEFTEPQLLSDVYLEDGSFIRMDNISLGYNLPKLPGNIKARVYGTVQNAFLITGYEGLDPELGVNGVDNNIYPRSRTFLVGLSLNF